MTRPRLAARVLAAATTAATVLIGTATLAGANDDHSEQEGYVRTDIVSDQGTTRLTDANLKNAWGLAFLPTGPLWVADNGTGKATIYPGATAATLSIAGLVVDTKTDGPTGIVSNITAGFVAGGHPARFIFDSEAGDLTAWAPPALMPPFPTDAIPVAHTAGAVYKGLAMGANGMGTFLFAANFHDARVDVFNDHFQRVTLAGAFHDDKIPSGYAPFGIAVLHNLVYVTYAKQDAALHDDVRGIGHGFVDVYDTSGNLVHRLVRHGQLDSPWGLAIAPAGFGRFSGDLLVGNFGNGRIHAYDPVTGEFAGTMRDGDNKPIVIDGLWALLFGNGVTGTPTTLIFSAGPNGEANGLLGFLTTS